MKYIINVRQMCSVLIIWQVEAKHVWTGWLHRDVIRVPMMCPLSRFSCSFLKFLVCIKCSLILILVKSPLDVLLQNDRFKMIKYDFNINQPSASYDNASTPSRWCVTKTSDSLTVITLSKRLSHLMCFPSSVNCLHSIAYDVAAQTHLPPRSVLHAHAETVRSEILEKKKIHKNPRFESKPWGIARKG